MSETTAVPGVGLLRSPARGKPARHHKRAGRKKSTVQENYCAAAPQTPDLPPPSQWRAGLSWRAGLPRAGWRSRPKTCWLGMSETTAVPGVGLLRSPARGKPARHHKRAGRKKSTVQENCCAAAAPKLPTCRRPPCGERACPALGGEAAPKPAGSVCLKQLRCLGWGCYAAQRGASPLATTSALAARNLQSKKTAALQPPPNSRPAAALPVASGLAPRWVAKPPQNLLARYV